MNIRSSIRNGLFAGIVNIFFVLLGVTSLVGGILIERLKLSSPEPGAWLVLLIVALGGGAMIARHAACKSWRETLITGLLAGASHGLLLAVFTWIVGSLAADGVEMFRYLLQLSADAVQLLTLGRSPLVAAVVMFVALTGAGLAGTAWAYASARYRWGEILGNRWSGAREKVLAAPAVQKVTRFKYSLYILYGVGLLLLFLAPLKLGQYWNYTLGTVGIYVILGLGLNIIIGMAGLLVLDELLVDAAHWHRGGRHHRRAVGHPGAAHARRLPGYRHPGVRRDHPHPFEKRCSQGFYRWAARRPRGWRADAVWH
jgi:hypothetical protein